VVRNILPARFNWPSFCLALSLMSAPVGLALWQVLLPGRRKDQAILLSLPEERPQGATISLAEPS
jgi:hypothetical protein